MQRDQARLDAARQIAEALSLAVPPNAPQPAPQVSPLPAMRPQPMPTPQGALSRPPGPQQVSPVSPLQNMPSFKSAPLQAALQGAEGIKGHPALTKPVGFAAGGLVVRGI